MKTLLKIFINTIIITLLTAIVLVSSDIIAVEFIKNKQFILILQFLFTFIAILLISKYNLKLYGFKLPKKINYRYIIICVALIAFWNIIITISFDVEHPIMKADLFEIILRTLLVAPLLEEIIFRGLVQSYLSGFKQIGLPIRKTFFSYPMIYSALLFTIAHLPMILRDMNSSPAYIFLFSLYILSTGVLMGYVREKADSLIPVIIIHSVFNFIAFIPDMLKLFLN